MLWVAFFEQFMLYFNHMKVLKFLKLENKKIPLNIHRAGQVVDFYQDSIEKIGRDQFKRLVEKGLSIPVFML